MMRALAAAAATTMIAGAALAAAPAATAASTGTTVQAWYADFLGRDADAGARYWLEGANAQRFPLEWVAQNVAASPEAVAAANRRGDLIETWYYTALSSGGDVRIPSPGEVTYWNGRARAIGALGAYRELYYTPEAISYRIEGWYVGLLNREPSPGEVAYWYPKEVESDINVGVLIASTPEYADHADVAS